MIQKNSLRLGNHVLYNSDIYEVFGLLSQNVVLKSQGGHIDHITYDSDMFEGIVLTGEILQNIGFIEAVNDSRYFYPERKLPKAGYGIELTLISNEWHIYCCNYPVDIKYLHQLENLFYDLTNSELPTI